MGNKQKGGALVVSILVISILTMVAASLMQSTLLEYKITENSIKSNEVFQLAESATDQVLNDIDNLSAAFKADGDELAVTLDSLQGEHNEVKATVRFNGQSMVTGGSLGLYQNLRFEVVGEAQIEGFRARSVVRQGASRTVPSL